MGSRLRLHLRTRVETFKGSGLWDEAIVTQEFPTESTAVLLCDVWDDHWCRGAVQRAEVLAGKIDQVIGAARDNGLQIIHSPSGTIEFYAGSPFRQRILAVPGIEPPEDIELPDSEPLPIDDSDGGCDSGEVPGRKPWSRQNSAIKITGGDVISDSGREIYGFMRHRGIENLISMGVHTNMCILKRSFGIKQMTRWGVKCVLVRDLTDAMYNPARPPYVSHEEGTELVVQHIEKCWCPTVLSDDLMRVYHI